MPESPPYLQNFQTHHPAFLEAGFGILHHLSEFVHSKDNWHWSRTIGGGLRPWWTASPAPAQLAMSILRSMIHGAKFDNLRCRKNRSRMSRLITVSLTLSSRRLLLCHPALLFLKRRDLVIPAHARDPRCVPRLLLPVLYPNRFRMAAMALSGHTFAKSLTKSITVRSALRRCCPVVALS